MTPLHDLRARLLRAGREAAAATLQRVPAGPRNALLARVAALMPSPYHAGELEVQRRAGTRVQGARSGLGVGAELPRKGASLLARQRFLVLAACDESGRLWATMFEGAPGFLSAPDSLTLAIEASLGPQDPLAEALARPAQVGLLAIDFETCERLRIEGECTPEAGGGVRVRVRTALENCPRYVRPRVLTSAEPRVACDGRVLTELDEGAAARLASTDIVFLGSRHPERGADVSHKAGEPGFLRVDGPRRLTLPDYSGNGMFQTLGNLSVDDRVGLLVPDFEDGTLVQLTGRARIDWDARATREFPDAQRLLRVELDAVRVREACLGLRAGGEG